MKEKKIDSPEIPIGAEGEESFDNKIKQLKYECIKENLRIKKVVYSKVEALLGTVVNITTEEQVNNIKALTDLLRSVV